MLSLTGKNTVVIGGSREVGRRVEAAIRNGRTPACGGATGPSAPPIGPGGLGGIGVLRLSHPQLSLGGIDD
jgi:hypothetical protein